MTDGRRTERVDGWLRRELTPADEVARRVSAAALEPAPASRRLQRRTLRAALATAALVLAVVVGLWWRGGEEPRAGSAAAPVRIANFGELVTSVDPSGRVWLAGPRREIAASSPRLIVHLGGNHEP